MVDAIGEDAGVLEAALALVDEWYEDAAPTHPAPAAKEPTVLARSGPARSREELAAMHSTVERLRHAIARHWPKHKEAATSDPRGSRNTPRDTREAMQTRRAQARRVLHAVNNYNRLQAMARLSLAVVETVQARQFDNEQMLTTLRSRLDVLDHIAKANRVPRITPTSGTVQELSNSPTFTDTGLFIRSQSGHYVPFKLSLVAEVVWERSRSMVYGGDKQDREQLSFESRDELYGFVTRVNQTPFGMMSSSGPSALRRVYEDDGSVLFILTSVKNALSQKQTDNIFAGLTIKQAMWTRLRRVERNDGSALDRPLVYIETSASLVMESTSGRAVPKDRLLNVWNAVMAISSQESRSRQTLENRLLDLSLERQKLKASGPSAA